MKGIGIVSASSSAVTGGDNPAALLPYYQVRIPNLHQDCAKLVSSLRSSVVLDVELLRKCLNGDLSQALEMSKRMILFYVTSGEPCGTLAVNIFRPLEYASPLGLLYAKCRIPKDGQLGNTQLKVLVSTLLKEVPTLQLVRAFLLFKDYRLMVDMYLGLFPRRLAQVTACLEHLEKLLPPQFYCSRWQNIRTMLAEKFLAVVASASLPNCTPTSPIQFNSSSHLSSNRLDGEQLESFMENPIELIRHVLSNHHLTAVEVEESKLNDPHESVIGLLGHCLLNSSFGSKIKLCAWLTHLAGCPGGLPLNGLKTLLSLEDINVDRLYNRSDESASSMSLYQVVDQYFPKISNPAERDRIGLILMKGLLGIKFESRLSLQSQLIRQIFTIRFLMKPLLDEIVKYNESTCAVTPIHWTMLIITLSKLIQFHHSLLSIEVESDPSYSSLLDQLSSSLDSIKEWFPKALSLLLLNDQSGHENIPLILSLVDLYTDNCFINNGNVISLVLEQRQGRMGAGSSLRGSNNSVVGNLSVFSAFSKLYQFIPEAVLIMVSSSRSCSRERLVFGYYLLKSLKSGTGSDLYSIDLIYQFNWIQLLEEEHASTQHDSSMVHCKLVNLLNQLVPHLFTCTLAHQLQVKDWENFSQLYSWSLVQRRTFLRMFFRRQGNDGCLLENISSSMVHLALTEALAKDNNVLLFSKTRYRRSLWLDLIFPFLRDDPHSNYQMEATSLKVFWAQSFTFNPSELAVLFYQFFRKSGNERDCFKSLVMNPLIFIAHVNQGLHGGIIRMNPLLCSMTLQLVEFLLEASQQFYRNSISNAAEDVERFLLYQSVAVIQVLIDIFDNESVGGVASKQGNDMMSIDNDYGSQLERIKVIENRREFCQFLHNQFLNQRPVFGLDQTMNQVSSLLFEQTFPISSIEYLVNNIPSIHVGLAWLRDWTKGLLQLAPGTGTVKKQLLDIICPENSAFTTTLEDATKQLKDAESEANYKFLFFLELSSHLLAKYPINSSLELATTCLNLYEKCCTSGTALSPSSLVIEKRFLKVIGGASNQLGRQVIEVLNKVTPVEMEMEGQRSRLKEEVIIYLLRRHNVILGSEEIADIGYDNDSESKDENLHSSIEIPPSLWEKRVNRSLLFNSNKL